MTYVFVWDPIQGRYVVNGNSQWQLSGAGLVWNPTTEKPRVPEYDAFQNPPDPPELKICRPCSEQNVVDEVVGWGTKETRPALIHACDGNGCECPVCDIVRTIQDMNRDWDLSDQIKTWPED